MYIDSSTKLTDRLTTDLYIQVHGYTGAKCAHRLLRTVFVSGYYGPFPFAFLHLIRELQPKSKCCSVNHSLIHFRIVCDYKHKSQENCHPNVLLFSNCFLGIDDGI